MSISQELNCIGAIDFILLKVIWLVNKLWSRCIEHTASDECSLSHQKKHVTYIFLIPYRAEGLRMPDEAFFFFI